MCCFQIDDAHTKRSIFFQGRHEQSLCLIAQITGTHQPRLTEAKWQARRHYKIDRHIIIALRHKLNRITQHSRHFAQFHLKPVKARLVDQYLHSASIGPILMRAQILYAINEGIFEARKIRRGIQNQYYGSSARSVRQSERFVT